MVGKQITELSSASSFNEGDLMMIRKSGMGVDRKINYADFIESIGNSAIDGYVAAIEQGQANKIVLTTANGAPVYKYYTGMKISFVSPIKSTGVVQVKIGALVYKNLLAYKSTSSVVLDQDDYIEAVLIGDVFYQVNNAQYVYTNDYKIVLIEPNLTAGYTDIFLESAYGVAKPAYYEGMTVNFLCTEDTKGLTRISIDGLPVKDMLENSGDYIDMIYTPLYKGQIVRLIYDGQSFIKDRFRVDDPKIESIIQPDPIKPSEPIIPPQNKSEFKIGTGQQFTTMQDALKAIFKEYGEDGRKKGGQQFVTLEITSDLVIDAEGKNRVLAMNIADLSWITVKATNNVIRFMGTLVTKGGNVWYFDKAFTFQEGTKIDATNLNCGDTYSLLTANTLDLKNIEITGLSNQMVGYCIYLTGNKPGNLNLTNCTISGGLAYAVYVNTGQVVNITNTKISAWGSHAFFLGTGEANIKNSDFSKSTITSTLDIDFGGSGAKITQANSKAKSSLTINTPSTAGTHWVIGSQEIQGV